MVISFSEAQELGDFVFKSRARFHAVMKARSCSDGPNQIFDRYKCFATNKRYITYSMCVLIEKVGNPMRTSTTLSMTFIPPLLIKTSQKITGLKRGTQIPRRITKFFYYTLCDMLLDPELLFHKEPILPVDVLRVL